MISSETALQQYGETADEVDTARRSLEALEATARASKTPSAYLPAIMRDREQLRLLRILEDVRLKALQAEQRS